MDLSKLTTPKINYLRENLNLTEDEEKIFNMLSKGKTIVEISMKTRMSEPTVSRRIRRIKDKILELEVQHG